MVEVSGAVQIDRSLVRRLERITTQGLNDVTTIVDAGSRLYHESSNPGALIEKRFDRRVGVYDVLHLTRASSPKANVEVICGDHLLFLNTVRPSQSDKRAWDAWKDNMLANNMEELRALSFDGYVERSRSSYVPVDTLTGERLQFIILPEVAEKYMYFAEYSPMATSAK